jgi:hypothetical protein
LGVSRLPDAPLTLPFDALTSDDLPLVGGKVVNLGAAGVM